VEYTDVVMPPRWSFVLVLVLVGCTESSKPSEAARAPDGQPLPEGAYGAPDGGFVFDVADADTVPNVSVAGTLVERLLNAPTKAVNQTSWQGVANGGYLRFALYGDGGGSVSQLGLAAVDFSWVPSDNATVTFTGNPWFNDLTIVEFGESGALIASSRSGGVFGQRWKLTDKIPGE
jgi:hypothetical protein